MGLKQFQESNCYHSGNTSCSKTFKSFASNIFLYFIFLAAVFLATFGNMVVIISVSHFRQLHTATNILTLSLAVTDFFIGIFIMPINLIKTMHQCWHFVNTVCLTHIFCYWALTSISVTHLVFLSIDRYYAVCHPLLYNKKMTIHVSLILVTLSWVCPMCYTVLCMYYLVNVLYNSDNNCLGSCATISSFVILVFDMLMTFVFPCSVMMSLYLRIFIVAIKHVKAIHASKSKVDSTRHKRGKNFQYSQSKATKTIGVVIFTFMLCFLPYHISKITETFVSFPRSVEKITEYLTLFNFAFNPIIYGLFYSWFRKAFIHILTCRIFKSESSLIKLF